MYRLGEYVEITIPQVFVAKITNLMCKHRISHFADGECKLPFCDVCLVLEILCVCQVCVMLLGDYNKI